jgi:predicted aspartyl protease
MTTGRNSFGCPTVTFAISGSRARLEFEGILDTGFVGFILLPIAQAVPLGLEIDGVNTFMTADGTEHLWPTSTARVEFRDRSSAESIALAYYGGDVLVGVSFLRTFQQSLILHRERVILMDESELDHML